MHRSMAPLKRGSFSAIPVSAVLLLSGCFFNQLQRSEENDIQRVEQKQAILQTEQDRSVTLKRQEEQLVSELSERQLSLDELNDRVQEINAENGRAIADNQAMRLRYNDLLGQLHETNKELALAQQGGSGAIEERRERIASLMTRLKSQLDLLLRLPQ